MRLGDKQPPCDFNPPKDRSLRRRRRKRKRSQANSRHSRPQLPLLQAYLALGQQRMLRQTLRPLRQLYTKALWRTGQIPPPTTMSMSSIPASGRALLGRSARRTRRLSNMLKIGTISTILVGRTIMRNTSGVKRRFVKSGNGKIFSTDIACAGWIPATRQMTIMVVP